MVIFELEVESRVCNEHGTCQKKKGGKREKNKRNDIGTSFVSRSKLNRIFFYRRIGKLKLTKIDNIKDLDNL